MVTYFVVQAFQKGKKGMLIPDQPKQARDENHCMLVAEKLALTCASVVAFSRSGNPESGEWDDAVILAQFGVSVDELVDLAS